MRELKQNEAATIPIFPQDNTDGEGVDSALTLTAVYIQRDGESTVAATSPTIMHEGNKCHSLAIPTASDLNFTGFATIRVVIADCFDVIEKVRVVAELTNAAAKAVFDKLPSRDYITGTDQSTGAIAAADKSDYGLADGAITDAKIAANAITSAKIAAAAITSSQLASNAITSAKIAINSIGASQIADGAITADKLGADAITADKIADNAIGADQIASNAITSTKVAAAALNGKGDWNTTTPPTAGAIADAVWDEATADHTTAGTFGKLLVDVLAKWSGITTLAGWLRLLARKDSTVATTHAAELAEINSIGGNYSNTADSLEATGDVVDTINNAVATGTITVVSHQAPNSRIVLVQGDSYENDNGRYLRWVNATGAEWPDDLTGATITFTAIRKTQQGAVGSVDADKKIVATGTVETATAPNQEVRCQLLPADTNKEVGLYGYDVEAKIGDVVHTLVTTEVDSATLLQESRKARDARSLEILRQYAEASS